MLVGDLVDKLAAECDVVPWHVYIEGKAPSGTQNVVLFSRKKSEKMAKV